jgi:hypothetical protein
MDGTIVCSRHRYRTDDSGDRPKIDLAYWLANEHKAYDDSLLPLAEQYKSDLVRESVFTIIATARVLAAPDRRFIRNKLGRPDAIVSRFNRADTRSGADLKIAGLKKVFDRYGLHKAKKFFWEDNYTYLHKVCQAIGAKGYLVSSEQGW